MITKFEDLADYQMCEFIYREEDIEDLRVGIRLPDDECCRIQTIYSMRGATYFPTFYPNADSFTERCSFVKALDTIHYNMEDYPELLI